MIEVTATISVAAPLVQRSSQWRRASSIGSKEREGWAIAGSLTAPAGAPLVDGPKTQLWLEFSAHQHGALELVEQGADAAHRVGGGFEVALGHVLHRRFPALQPTAAALTEDGPPLVGQGDEDAAAVALAALTNNDAVALELVEHAGDARRAEARQSGDLP